MIVKIVSNDRGNPPGKLADAELHFGGESPLAGLKLIGFSIWERRGGSGRMRARGTRIGHVGTHVSELSVVVQRVVMDGRLPRKRVRMSRERYELAGRQRGSESAG